MAALQPLPSCRFNLIFVFLFVIVPLVSTKTCKKLDTCSCEMDDGTGIISLQDLDNEDGTAKYKNIKFATSDSFTAEYNPCTPLKASGPCKGNNLCQDETATSLTFPCGLPDTTFTMDTDNNVVINYGKTTFEGHTRYSQITLKCTSKPDTASPFGSGITEADSGKLSKYTATFTSKCACPGKCHYSSSYFSSGLSIGSILLIIFFPLLILYFFLGIIINKFARKKEGFPDVIPNHSFWGNLPFLVKDGCVFSCDKLKGCCSSLSNRVRGDSYAKI